MWVGFDVSRTLQRNGLFWLTFIIVRQGDIFHNDKTLQESHVQECTLCLRIYWGESFGQYVIVQSEYFRNSVRKKNNLLSEIERTLPWKETLAQRNFLIVFWKIYKAIFNLECRKTVRIYFSDFVRKGGERIFSLQTKWKKKLIEVNSGWKSWRW